MSVDAAALVRRVRSSSRLVQLQAPKALGDLASSSHTACQDAIAAGAVAAIVQLGGLGSGGSLQEGAARALRMLSEGEESAVLAAFSDVGAIGTLVTMLQSGMSSGSTTIQLSAAAALRNLAACDGGAVEVAAAGAIQPLVELLLARQGQPLDEVDAAAAGALWGFAAQGKQLGLEVAQHGGVPTLLWLLERRSMFSVYGTSELIADTTLMGAAATLACVAAFDEESQAAAVAAGGVQRLAALLSHPDADVQYATADALRALLTKGSQAAKAAFAEAQAAPAAIRLLGSPSERVQTHAAGVLGNATGDSAANSANLLSAGAMQPLVQLLRTPGHPAHEWAAIAVGNLAVMQPEAALAAIEQAGGVMDTLQQLAADSGDEGVKKAASRTMGVISSESDALLSRQAGTAEPAGSGAGSTAAASGSESSPSASQLATSPARVCAAPGCGATRGLKRCGGCSAVRYCSAECSRAHWQEHKAECCRLQAERAAAAAAGEGGEEPAA